MFFILLFLNNIQIYYSHTWLCTQEAHNSSLLCTLLLERIWVVRLVARQDNARTISNNPPTK
jgi:hypothetical protein